MEEKVEKLISYVQSSLYFCNEAFNEIWHITQTPNSKEEYDIVSGHPFGFYGVALQYCFIMEYTKLLHPNSKNENENVASIPRLNKCAMDLLRHTFRLKYDENKRLLKCLQTSELYLRLKDMRNKKFGHSDSDEINNPWKVEGFTGKQIEEIKNHINVLLKVFNNILEVVKDSSFALHNDTRTANFIRFHAKYKQYYYKNYIKALEEGFGLHDVEQRTER